MVFLFGKLSMACFSIPDLYFNEMEKNMLFFHLSICSTPFEMAQDYECRQRSVGACKTFRVEGNESFDGDTVTFKCRSYNNIKYSKYGRHGCKRGKLLTRNRLLQWHILGREVVVCHAQAIWYSATI